MKRLYSKLILLIVCLALIATNAKEPSIDQIWLGHRSHDPGKLVVNWISKEPGESIVRFGRTDEYGQEVRIANDTTLHHVEIPLVETGGVYHYSVHTGNQSSKGFTFKAYPKDVLRVAVVADWQGLPDLSAIKKDDVHLLVTAGDNIKNIHQLCGAGKKACVKPYLQLIGRYPELFRSVPFMPVLGNHDKQIRPRGNKPPSQPVYDIEATAFRQFFELPGDEWKWHFDIPGFDIRFAALDLHHISDQGSTWQSCHSFGKDSEQFLWYDKLMKNKGRKFVVTLYNERNVSMRAQALGAWHALFRKGTIAITGFGHYAERAEVDGFPYYNTSLSGKGTHYPDPKSAFLRGMDSYVLLTITKNPAKMVVEIKGLNGKVLDRNIIN